MRAHQMNGDMIANTIEVASLDVIPNLIDAVIGGAIGDRIVDGAVVPKPAPAPVVPKEVTSRQATEALIRRGQYDTVIAILNDPDIEPDPVKRHVNMNEFLRSQVFERDRPLTVAMGAVLGIDLDEWFVFASGL